MKHTKKIKLKLYECTATFVICDNINKVFNLTAKRYKDDAREYGSMEGVMMRFRGGRYYVFYDRKLLSHNLIAHELFHLTNNICKDREIRGEEGKCWLMGYLTSEVYKLIEKKKIKVNGKRTK